MGTHPPSSSMPAETFPSPLVFSLGLRVRSNGGAAGCLPWLVKVCHFPRVGC